MEQQVSIAEARQSLARLVHAVEEKSPVVITRRGRPVAVLVSYADYKNQRGKRSFLEAVGHFRNEHRELLEELADTFEGVRDEDPGREVAL